MENLLKYKNLVYFPVLVLISSWIHFSTTHSLKVDGNSIQPIALRFFLFACIAFSFGMYVFNAYKLYFQEKETEKNELRWLGYLFLGLSVFTLPIFSNDFFSLIGYSDAYLKGYSIYTDPIAPSYSFVVDYINPSYLNLTCKYGPINVLIMNMAVSVIENSLGWSFIFSKLLFGLAGVFYIEFSLKFYAFNKKYSQLLILIPLWFFQGIGQFHNDIFGVLFIMIGIYYSIQKPRWYSVVFFVLAALCKFTFIVFLIYPILVLINQSKKIITKEISFKLVSIGIVLFRVHRILSIYR
jgi:hypothetical protein